MICCLQSGIGLVVIVVLLSAIDYYAGRDWFEIIKEYLVSFVVCYLLGVSILKFIIYILSDK